MKKKPALVLAMLLPAQIAGIRILAMYPSFVEQWYSLWFYPKTSSLMRIGLGFLPFSLGDLLYAALIIMFIFWLVKRFRQKFRNPRRWGLEALATLSLLYFCFNLFWGFNYYRLPLHQTLQMERKYSTQALTDLTKRLLERTNEIHHSLTRNDSLPVVVPYSKDELLEMTPEGYQHLQVIFPKLEYKRSSLKPSMYSLPLSYMGFNGYLNPWTNEGQVNTRIVPFKLPTTASHEVGHQLGFAKENEANFLACLSTMNHPDPYFKYSGYTFALSYCLSELFARDPALTNKVLEDLHYGVRLNYQEVRTFWARHKNPLEPVFIHAYGSYLKANNQPGGMKSYSYVVALLVNYFQDRQGLL